MSLLGNVGRQGRTVAHRLADDASLWPVEGHLATFDGATAWLNSEHLTPEGLRGRVVVVDFWTYTCVNWLRTFPYLRAWHAKYAELGLTVVGVHTPEFSFEHEVDNVILQAHRIGVDYPIAIDNEYRVWRAFDNHYWPALYVADADGGIRFHHFGEGEYEMTEMVIQHLLLESGSDDFDRSLVDVDPEGLELAANWHDAWSPETYLGAGRSQGFASPDGQWFGESHVFAEPQELGLNEWAPTGDWTVGPDAAVAHEPGAKIGYRFHARDVNLVMRSAQRGSPIPFRVSLDGSTPGPAHGGDTSEEGSGTLDEPRLYQLIRQRGPVDEHLFEIEFLEPGGEAYCFTFG